MTYLDFSKMVIGERPRKEFIKLNNSLNNDTEFNSLTNAEKFCIKCKLYNWFKISGYKDSKTFNFLIATKEIN